MAATWQECNEALWFSACTAPRRDSSGPFWTLLVLCLVSYVYSILDVAFLTGLFLWVTIYLNPAS